MLCDHGQVACPLWALAISAGKGWEKGPKTGRSPFPSLKSYLNVSLSAVSFFIILLSLFILRERERERERERARERQRERERENPMQAPHCQRRARCGARTHGTVSRNRVSDAQPTEPPRRPLSAVSTVKTTSACFKMFTYRDTARLSCQRKSTQYLHTCTPGQEKLGHQTPADGSQNHKLSKTFRNEAAASFCWNARSRPSKKV